jgi:hypothetical protein
MDMRRSARHQRVVKRESVPTGESASEALALPQGLGAGAVRRELDRERLERQAPDLDAERVARIARIREEIRAGRYITAERLAIALSRALGPRGGRR